MPPPVRSCYLINSATFCAKQLRTATHPKSRSFSSTPQCEQRTTRARRALYRWLATHGEALQQPLEGSTNYLSAYDKEGRLKRKIDQTEGPDDKGLPEATMSDLRPFTKNPEFISQSVLTEEAREAIWSNIMRDGKSVREVSAEFGVAMERVGAVVRLMEIQKEWERIGKPLARPFAKAVLSMLPKTRWDADDRSKRQTHESINDLPVHAATGQQIFHPTSESRHFTRADAAKVFDETLLPADERVPHPELALMHADMVAGLSYEQRQAKQQSRDAKAEKKRLANAARQAAKEAAIVKIETPRWQFKITDINADDIGKDGRGKRGVGWRYGVPMMDRSRGQVRIPTRVE